MVLWSNNWHQPLQSPLQDQEQGVTKREARRYTAVYKPKALLFTRSEQQIFDEKPLPSKLSIIKRGDFYSAGFSCTGLKGEMKDKHLSARQSPGGESGQCS